MVKSESSPPTSKPSSDPLKTSFKLQRQRRLFFKARMSKFDLSNPDSYNDTFRGFYTLFWIAMGFYVIQTLIRCYEQEGTILSAGFYRLISKDGLTLLISDMLMVSTTLFSVLFSKLLVWEVIRYETVGFVLQHVCQTVFLFFNVYWTFWRDWPWVQSGFFTLHTIVMMMKMHSYTALNGDLSMKSRRLRQLKAYLPKLISESQNGPKENGVPGKKEDPLHTKHGQISSEEEQHEVEEEIKFLEEELVHGNTRYPNNVTLMNYLDYLLVPSLVYWMEYPRTDRIRPWYILEKAMATTGSFLFLYVTTERWILPKLYDPHMSEPRVIVELMFPFMINYLFIFYIIFECILNAFAELSRFADRNFYDDWWNSVTYDEFARKWNKPVHQWLLRHVYAQSMESYKLTKTNATFVTFLLSSCLHELVLMVVTRKVRMYLFVLQMFQLPLIFFMRRPFIRKNAWLGNTVFWLCMLVGPPLLGILYCREVFWSNWSKSVSPVHHGVAV
ncbi:MBOAT, membrane-bound O-acyltransferase family-domain-containing protein [Radiomyces spectabilis]|uniref:MBOAT, membrane-bound O-acyltransferase family-domain-containing protein n=1 Tax=Radiomyces spectabilis TaxID=64574 RepID=UPI0022208C79|nr:MBOAT, membrane-bound O-acyltransferase family-domain-containing protein [Radiomyces spectabilis]KAI8388190.1 MBOAT, membrane-bound O-acyltransferase family-domain-containing protein [Radiomyces spectabilis]